jgi:selenide,water dikinase
MVTLNSPGAQFAELEGVKAMTDVTGFGLLGHLSEMCAGSNLAAEIAFDKVPVIESLGFYLEQKCFPGGTQRNWNSYGHKIGTLTDEQRYVLADPQTSGGLLVAVTEESSEAFEQLLRDLNLPSNSFGRLKEFEGGDLIQVI